MAQPSPSRAHVTGRTAAAVLLAAAPAGTPGIPPFDHITPAAGGLPVLLPCPVACAAAAALLSVPTRGPGPQAAGVMTVSSRRGNATGGCEEVVLNRRDDSSLFLGRFIQGPTMGAVKG